MTAHEMAVLRDIGNASDALLGNASLCLADAVKQPGVLTALAALDPVPALIEIAHKRTGAAQKNAAIALARLAPDQGCLKKLRDLHGIEIIARYVKP